MAAAPRISDTPPSSPRQSPLVLDGPGGAGDTCDGIAAFLSSPGRLLSLLFSPLKENRTKKKMGGREPVGFIDRTARIARSRPQSTQNRHLLMAGAQVLRQQVEIALGRGDLRVPEHHRQPHDVPALAEVVR